MSVARSGTLLSLLCTGLDRIHWGALVLCIWPDHIGFSLCTPGFISEGISTWLRRIWCLWILRCQVKIQLRCVVLFLFFSFFFWRGGATRVVFPRRYGNARVSGGIIGEWLSNLWNSLFFLPRVPLESEDFLFFPISLSLTRFPLGVIAESPRVFPTLLFLMNE